MRKARYLGENSVMVSITHRWNKNYANIMPQILGKILKLDKDMKQTSIT